MDYVRNTAILHFCGKKTVVHNYSGEFHSFTSITRSYFAVKAFLFLVANTLDFTVRVLTGSRFWGIVLLR